MFTTTIYKVYILHAYIYSCPQKAKNITTQYAVIDELVGAKLQDNFSIWALST
jgi:hypothetical protein